MAHTEHDGARHHQSSEAAGHELTDASLGGVERFMIVTAVLLAASFALVWLLYGMLASREAALDVRPSPVVAREGDRLPPNPRLQTRPGDDLSAFRRSEAAAVDTWAWVDKAGGVAQVPVSRAIEILAERGLPVPATAPGDAPAGAASAPGAAAPAAGTVPGSATAPPHGSPQGSEVPR
jgi:hypothetical protein